MAGTRLGCESRSGVTWDAADFDRSYSAQPAKDLWRGSKVGTQQPAYTQ
jgi:hypothetical protein